MNVDTIMDPITARAISWDELVAGRWTLAYTKPPSEPYLLAVGCRWPEWRSGTPPTWAAFVAAPEISAADRRWLVARVLLRDHDHHRLVAWAVDCAAAVVHLAGSWEAAIRAQVITPLRAWIAGDDSIDLAAVRRHAWAIYAADALAALAALAALDVAGGALSADAAALSATDTAAALAADALSTATFSADARAADALSATDAADARAALSAVDDAAADFMLRLALPHLAAVSASAIDIR